MATFPERKAGTLTVKSRFQDQATSPVAERGREHEDPPLPIEDRTAARINQRERGDEEVKDLYAAPDRTSNETGHAEAAAAVRKELAARVSKAIGRVIASCGTIKMAADLELLKRELSRCHDGLGPFPTEGDFLSMAVLVESELGTKGWREISKQELGALQAVIDVGVREPRVTFDEFNRSFRMLNASGWVTGPALELGEVGEDPADE